MLEKIIDYEHDLFLLINGSQSTFWDQFMWLFSGKIAWEPAAFFFIVFLFYKNRHRWIEILLIFMAISLVVILCDQFASSFCKPFFERLRPTYHPDFIGEVKTVFGYRGGRFGFISSHAANAFGFAMLTSLIFKYRFYSITIFIWATVNSYSRIYLGVHFISDIVPGIIIGLLFGWLVYKIFTILKKTIIKNKPKENEEYNLNRYNGINTITYMLILTITALVIISLLYVLNIIPAVTVK